MLVRIVASSAREFCCLLLPRGWPVCELCVDFAAFARSFQHGSGRNRIAARREPRAAIRAVLRRKRIRRMAG